VIIVLTMKEHGQWKVKDKSILTLKI